jgi:hypothetical protein
LSTADRLAFSYAHKPTSAADHPHRQHCPSCKHPLPILGPPTRSPSPSPRPPAANLRDRTPADRKALDRPAAPTRTGRSRPPRRPDNPSSRSDPASLPLRPAPTADNTPAPPRTPATRSGPTTARHITHSQPLKKQRRHHPPDHRSRCNAASSISRPAIRNLYTRPSENDTPLPRTSGHVSGGPGALVDCSEPVADRSGSGGLVAAWAISRSAR